MSFTVTYKILQVSSMILDCHKVSQDFETNLESSCKIHAIGNSSDMCHTNGILYPLHKLSVSVIATILRTTVVLAYIEVF